MSLESKEDLYIEFGDIVPCDCSEGSYGHINALVERDCSPRHSFGDSFRAGHLGDADRQDFNVEGGESEVSNVDS